MESSTQYYRDWAIFDWYYINYPVHTEYYSKHRVVSGYYGVLHLLHVLITCLVTAWTR